FELNPGHQLLAESRVGHTEDRYFFYLRMSIKKLLDLARIHVLAAADDHVLDAPGDVHVALIVHHGEIARVHPAGRVDRFRGRLFVVPIAEHHAVTARAELAKRTAR